MGDHKVIDFRVKGPNHEFPKPMLELLLSQDVRAKI